MATIHHPVRPTRGRRLGVRVAKVYVLLSVIYFAAIEVTIPSPVNVPFKYAEWFVFAFAVVSGLAYAASRGHSHALQKMWLVTTTIACLSRGIALMVGDSPTLNFWQQMAGSLTWYLIWVGSILAALALMANEILGGE